MKKIIFILFALLLFASENFAQGGVTFFDNDMILNTEMCEGLDLLISPESTVSATWDFFDCEGGGLTFDFSNFQILPAPGSQIEILPDLSTFCWTNVGDAPLPPCNLFSTNNTLSTLEFGQYTFFPSQGAIEPSIDIFINYNDLSLGFPIPGACYVATLTFQYPIEFECPCQDITTVTIESTVSDCYHEDCSGILACDFDLELIFDAPIDPAFLVVHWYNEGNLFAIEHGSSSTELEGCMGCGQVTAEVRYHNFCVFEPEPVFAACDGFGPNECSGGYEDRILVESNLEGCVVNANGEVTCTYSLSVSPNENILDTPVNIDDVEWTVGGNVYTGESVIIAVEEGDNSVLIEASGQAGNSDCVFTKTLNLPCNGDVCGNPCSFADNLELVMESVECPGEGQGCNYQFGLSDPDIYNYIADINWTWYIFVVGGPDQYGTGSMVSAPAVSRVRMRARITFTTGCTWFQEMDVVCDDMTCESCTPEAQLVAISEDLYGCKFQLEVTGCENIYLGPLNENPAMMSLSICGDEGCIIDFSGIQYNGGLVIPFTLHCNYEVDVDFEIIQNGIVLTSLNETAFCADHIYCGHDRPDGGEGGEGRSAEVTQLSGNVVAPNPSTGILNINLADLALRAKSTVAIYSLDGSLQVREDLSLEKDTYQIDINHLANGMYLLKVENNGAIHYSQIVVLAK